MMQRIDVVPERAQTIVVWTVLLGAVVFSVLGLWALLWPAYSRFCSWPPPLCEWPAGR
ncbi:hypothetical protein [Kribbella swartbergensis]